VIIVKPRRVDVSILRRRNFFAEESRSVEITRIANSRWHSESDG